MQGLNVIETENIIRTEDFREGWDKLSLHERSDLFYKAWEIYQENDDLTEEELELIAETEEKLKEKIIAYGYRAQKMDQAAELVQAEADALKKQAKAMEERAKVFSNNADRMRASMQKVMLGHNLKTLKAPFLTVSLRKKPAKIVEPENLNIEEVPAKYVRVKKELNRKDLLADMKKGILEGDVKFTLSEPEFSVSIR